MNVLAENCAVRTPPHTHTLGFWEGPPKELEEGENSSTVVG